MSNTLLLLLLFIQEKYEDPSPPAGPQKGGYNNNGKASASLTIQPDYDNDAKGNGNDVADRTIQRYANQNAYQGLQDMPSPSGKLSDRISRLRQRCMEALGRDTFFEAYSFLKQYENVSHIICINACCCYFVT